MLFSSLEFIFIFLPLLCLTAASLKNNNQAFLTILLLGSFIFYAYYSITALLLMICSIIINFSFSQKIFHNRLILILSLVFNISLLIYFKYSYFIYGNIKQFLHLSWNFTHVLLPLGISFYTLQQIAYLVDCYKENNKESDFLKYTLFVSFFPHSIAGPIVQFKEIRPQFDILKLSYQNFAIGGTIFIIGLFKKLIIADNLAPSVNALFNGAAAHIIPSSGDAWLGALGYTLQLYFDFSGYSDMAIGLAKIFNINFPINFNSPYQSTSIIEFWRRWHITLSNFLKNYLYIPFGGSRQGDLNKYRNLILTMFIAGIWHGANWTFFMWGLTHGILLVINHIWIKIIHKRNLKFLDTKIYTTISWLVTMMSVIFAWVLFRAENISTATLIYKSMLNFNHLASLRYDFVFDQYTYIMIMAILISLFCPNIKNLFDQENIFKNFKPKYLNSTGFKTLNLIWYPSIFYAAAITILSFWAIFHLLSHRKIEFLYFNF